MGNLVVAGCGGEGDVLPRCRIERFPQNADQHIGGGGWLRSERASVREIYRGRERGIERARERN